MARTDKFDSTRRRSGTSALARVALLCGVALASVTASLPAMAEPAVLPAFERVLVAPPNRHVSDFELTNQDGKAVHFSALLGKPALVFFGFTNCADICPAAMGKLRLLRDSDPALRQVAYVMISVDGARDTPAALKTFLQPFPQEFTGLTGDPAKVQTIAQQFAAAFFKDPAAADGSYAVQHSQQIFVVDRQGNVRAEFHGATLEAMAAVTRAVINEKT